MICVTGGRNPGLGKCGAQFTCGAGGERTRLARSGRTQQVTVSKQLHEPARDRFAGIDDGNGARGDAGDRFFDRRQDDGIGHATEHHGVGAFLQQRLDIATYRQGGRGGMQFAFSHLIGEADAELRDEANLRSSRNLFATKPDSSICCQHC